MKLDWFYIVGIGLSAGGIKALNEILHYLPNQTNAAFLIVQHLEPSHKSQAAKQLQKNTKIKVNVAQPGQAIECNNLYMLSEGQVMTVINEKIILTNRSQSQKVNTAVDTLFSSMALSLGTRAISVVLSGLGRDGSFGTTNIYDNGGITIAQMPFTAEYSSMPSAALLTGKTIFALSPKEIAETLIEIIKV